MLNLVRQLQVSVWVGGCIVLPTTLSRLLFRRRRLWWDDAFALLSMLFFVMLFANVFILTHEEVASQADRVVAYYLMTSSYYGVIWFARLCMLFSIIRINPDPLQSRPLVFAAAAFTLAGIFLTAQIFWVCAPNPAWRKLSPPQCTLGTQVVVCSLVVDIASDYIIMAAALKLFRDILDKGLRRRLTLIFSACIMTTVVALVHGAYIMRNGGIKILIVADVEACVSLLACNVPVFAVATIKLGKDTSKTDEASETSKISVQTNVTDISSTSC